MKHKIMLLSLIFFILLSCNSSKNESKEASKNEITNTYWKLKTLEGKEITSSENKDKAIYFTLENEKNSANGFSGCNSFSGEYTLEEGNRIRFTKFAVTMMACPDVAFNEADFLKAFELADNYTINNGFLSLNIGRRAPLATFEAVDQ
jgi:heat shock protein HslJ